MRYLLLFLLTFLVGCEPPQTFDDKDPDMIRQSRNPPVAPYSPHGIPQVVPTIPREGLWSGYNQLGYQAKYGPDQRNTQTILKLDEWGPPEVWTLSLFLDQKLEAFNGFGVTARINFGAGGSTQVIETDWINGSQISLPMNAVNVEAIFSDIDVTTEGAGLSLGVQLARGARGGTRGPVKTIAENITVGALASSSVFEIPAFAKAVYAISTGGTTNNLNDALVRLITLSGNFSADVTGTISGVAASNGVGLPVVGRAKFVRLSNGTGASVNATLYAEIDG